MQIGHTRDDAALSKGRIPLVVGPTASPRGGVVADLASWVIPLPWLGPGARLIVSGVSSPKKICQPKQKPCPRVPSDAEVCSLLGCITNAIHRTCFAVMHACGQI